MKNKTIDKVLFFAVFIPIALLVIFILLTIYIYSSSSNGNPLHNPDNWVVGEYGEPPKIHEELFNETYTILYSDYISAINLIFDFKNERNFDVFNFTQCFNDALMFDSELPCGAIYSEKGAPTKYLIRFIVKDRDILGCSYDHPKFVEINIMLTSSQSTVHSDYFKSKYEPMYKKLEQKHDLVKSNWNEKSCKTYFKKFY